MSRGRPPQAQGAVKGEREKTGGFGAMWLTRSGRGSKVPAERILRGGSQHVVKAARVCPWGQTLESGGPGSSRIRGMSMSTSQPGGSAPSGTFQKFDDNRGSVQCLKLRNGCKIPQVDPCL
jgi:hypothetical protein